MKFEILNSVDFRYLICNLHMDAFIPKKIDFSFFRSFLKKTPTLFFQLTLINLHTSIKRKVIVLCSPYSIHEVEETCSLKRNKKKTSFYLERVKFKRCLKKKTYSLFTELFFVSSKNQF